MHATHRVYRTTAGELVRENDPRGAYLAYAPGQEVVADDHRAYEALYADGTAGGPRSSVEEAQAYLARREQRAEAEPGKFIHDRALTEAADAMAAQAQRDEVPAETAEGQPVAQQRLWRTDDGGLVADGDLRAATLAYRKGAVIADADLDAYRALAEPAGEPEPDAEVKDEGADTAAAGVVAPDAKAAKPAKATSASKG